MKTGERLYIGKQKSLPLQKDFFGCHYSSNHIHLPHRGLDLAPVLSKGGCWWYHRANSLLHTLDKSTIWLYGNYNNAIKK